MLTLALQLYIEVSDDQMDYVVKKIKAFFKEKEKILTGSVSDLPDR